MSIGAWGGSGGAAAATPHPYLYLPDGWDAGWKAAKLASVSSPRTVAVIGDSVMMGSHASAAMTKGLWGLLRAALSATYGLYGDYYNTNLINGTATYAGTLPWVLQANALANQGSRYGHHVNNSAAVAFGLNGDMQFTSPYACTAIDLIMCDALGVGGFTWQYNVDNAAGTGLVTVNVNGFGGGTGGATPYRVSLSGLSNATHTIRLGNGTVTGGLDAVGAITYNPGASAGLLFANEAITGSYVGTWQQGGSSTATQWWQGYFKTSANDTAHPVGFGAPAGAPLVFLEFGINDCASFQWPIETYFHTMRKLILSLRRGSPNCSIMFVVPCNPDKDSSDTAQFFGTSGFARDWPKYIAAMYELAQAFSCAVVNTHAKWGETPNALGFIDTDPHPNDAGYADMATTILSVL